MRYCPPTYPTHPVLPCAIYFYSTNPAHTHARLVCVCVGAWIVSFIMIFIFS